jgi:hypothetical protein
MKFSGRFTAAALVLTLLFTMIAAVACADSADGGGSDTLSESVEPEATDMKSLRAKIDDGLPAKNYDGATFTIMVRNGMEPHFYVEEQTGEIVDDSVYSRGLNVETRFNIELALFPVAGGWDQQATYLSAIRQSVLADDDAFDCIEGYAAYIGTFASEKLFGSWLDLPYIDTSKPWWSQDAAAEFTINGRLFFLTGDLALSLWKNFFVILFNKTLVTDYRFPNMYELVRSGDWTLDKLKELVQGVNRDLDGDSDLDKYDQYGFAISRGNYMDVFHLIFDKPITIKDQNGIPQLNIMSEDMVTMAEAVLDLLYNNSGVYSIPESGTSDQELRDMFIQNQIVLSPQYLHSVEIFRDSETDFGIIPYPKFDERQQSYRTASQDGYSLFCYPITVNDLEMCSVIIEALAAESYKQVVPAYYEVALKTKYSRDDESAEMLDIIRDCLAFNFGSINSANIGGPVQLIRQAVASSKGNYARIAKGNEKAISIKLEKLLEAYLD